MKDLNGEEGTTTNDSSSNSDNSDFDDEIFLQAGNIINIIKQYDHQQNPRRLVSTLEKLNYSHEAYKLALETLNQPETPKHISKILNQVYQEKQSEFNRDQLVQNQADFILKTLENFEGNDFNQLTNQLLSFVDSYNGKTFKSDAFKLVLNNYILSEQEYTAVNNAYIERRIGSVKTRDFDEIGNKPAGVTSGRVTIKAKKEDVNSFSKKYKSQWMQKSSKDTEDLGGVAGDVSEYLASNLMDYLMDGASPKVRLHKDSAGNITILSKYLENFNTLSKYTIEEKAAAIKKTENFANFFVSNLLIGDWDLNPGNVGIINSENGSSYLARIDFGLAFEYNVTTSMNKAPKLKPNAPFNLMNELIIKRGYPSNIFTDLNFITDLQQEINRFDSNSMNEVLYQSMINLREAYGNNFLQRPEIANDLKQRFGFNKNVILTEELIVKTILKNMSGLLEQIDHFSEEQIRQTFPEHSVVALETCLELKKDNGLLDYTLLLEKIKEKAPDFNCRSLDNFDHGEDPVLKEAIVQATREIRKRQVSSEYIEEGTLSPSSPKSPPTKKINATNIAMI